MKYHIQETGRILRTFCGRHIGTPGGKIYPGVHAELPSWFDGHRFPRAMQGHICASCERAREAKTRRALEPWERHHIDAVMGNGATFGDAVYSLRENHDAIREARAGDDR